MLMLISVFSFSRQEFFFSQNPVLLQDAIQELENAIKSS